MYVQHICRTTDHQSDFEVKDGENEEQFDIDVEFATGQAGDDYISALLYFFFF